MNTPRATIRLQFCKDFTLQDATRLVPYFFDLGISHVYASPLLQSAAGSTHGYDTIDCTLIDPDRGGIDGLRDLSAALKAHDMGLILDIVPNHMGVDTNGNIWWEDILANGRASRFASFFDIDWGDDTAAEPPRIVLPFLGDTLANVVASGDISVLEISRMEHRIAVGERLFPVRPEDAAEIASQVAPQTFDPATEAGRAALIRLLDAQHYRLASWRSGNALINWRRFFNVSSLAALRMEDNTVFEAYHDQIFALYKEGLIDGLRIDHIDGLTRPAEYCNRLTARLSQLRPDQTPLVYVEKILREGENLPSLWPVSGTTGYEFLEAASLLMHDPRGEAAMTASWRARSSRTFAETERAARAGMLRDSFQGELVRLTALCNTAVAAHRPHDDITTPDIESCLTAICLDFPRYRSYFSEHASQRDAGDPAILEQVVRGAAARGPAYLAPTMLWLASVIDGSLPDLDPPLHHDIAAGFEHLTAPLAAKAGEDTAFYRYGRALSRVEVGGDPAVFARPVKHFHAFNTARRKQAPLGLLCTSTHDHKRGADTRARLAVLSEPAAGWTQTLDAWAARHAAFRDGGPDEADAYIVYQAVIGAWPATGVASADRKVLRERLQGFLTKALREAARHTTWTSPNARYEHACARFLDHLLDDEASLIDAYVSRIGATGALNGLQQALLRMTCPGVPDLYQGAEFWDLSLVDPDNRRAVDYQARQDALRTAEPFHAAVGHWADGIVLQSLTAALLNFRRQHPKLFADGTYEPVATSGPLAEHVVAFLRRDADDALLVIAPRLTQALSPDGGLATHDCRWAATRLLDTGCHRAWTDILTPGREIDLAQGTLGFLDGTVPLAVLHAAG